MYRKNRGVYRKQSRKICGLRGLETRGKLADLVSNSDIKHKDCIVLHAPEDAEWDDEMAKQTTEI